MTYQCMQGRGCGPWFRLRLKFSAVVLGAVHCIVGGSARALSIAQSWPMETISTAPLVRLSHGWTGGDIYDMTMEVGGECTTEPVRLLFSSVALAEDLNTSSPPGPAVRVTVPTIWVGYDLVPAERYPVYAAMQEQDVTTSSVGIRPHSPGQRA